MPVFIEHLTEVIFAAVVIIFLATSALALTAMRRRKQREKYFQIIDRLRAKYEPVISGLLDQQIEYGEGLDALKKFSGPNREYFLEQLLLKRNMTPVQVPIVRRLCDGLGLVGIWQEQLSGQIGLTAIKGALSHPEGILRRFRALRFLLRAKAAENLGMIRHQPSWMLLVEALQDTHPDVRTVAVRSLGAIREPESVPALLELLHSVILEPSSRVSLRTVKSALIAFPLHLASRLLVSLELSNPRIRFVATDIIREMVEREATSDEKFVLDSSSFGPELVEVFLTRLFLDDNPDVRARAAGVIGYIPDARSTPALLTLIGDPEWFVRLHAVRALANRKFMTHSAEIAKRLTDSHWKVREAAAHVLRMYGRVGLDELIEYFLGTTDRYSKEQISDEIQRAGLVPVLLAQFKDDAEGRAAQTLEQLIDIGKTSYMVELLEKDADRILRKTFLEKFARKPNDRIREWLGRLAVRETDPELRQLARSSTEATTD